MRKIYTILGLSLLASLCVEAKIWRVNNNNGITADFTSIQAAHDGAQSGDTLHLEGSANTYGGLTSSKKLVIIGPGYLLDENKDLQAVALSANIQGLTYNPGSEGSEVMGIIFLNHAINVFCNDIVIKRNSFLYYLGGDPEQTIGGINLYYPDGNSSVGVSNVIISQNFGITLNIQYPSTGILITNNYILGPNYIDDNSAVLTQHQDAVSIIQNNVIRRGKLQVYKSNVSNNIMFSGTFEGLGNGNLVSNNISNAEQFGSENGNKSNVDMTTVFEETGSRDAYWKLKSGSPAKGAGFGSTNEKPVDSGMYGGTAPYVLSGIPPVPSVYFFVNQPVGSSNDPIDVTIKVRSNN